MLCYTTVLQCMPIKSYIINQICTSATSNLDHSEARNDQGRRVKQEFKMNVMKLLRFGLPKIMFFLPFVRKGDF